jgi:hypothetical protein
LAEIRDPKIIAKKTAQLEMKEVQKYARRNVEGSMTTTIIPRTMREPQCNVSNILNISGFFFLHLVCVLETSNGAKKVCIHTN